MLSIVLKSIQTAPKCMEFEQALKLVDEVLFARKNRHLSDPEMTILQGTWQGIAYDEMALRSQYSVNYLMRDVGPNLWRSLSEILGEKVSKSNCRTVLERYQIGEKKGREVAIATQKKKPSSSLAISHVSPQQDWGEAPDIATFYGRERELQTLDRWVREEQCRTICIWGMGGIGKTTLSRQFVETVKDRFDYLFWRSLRNLPRLLDLLAEILQLFDSRKTLKDREVSPIWEYLQKHRCLLVFDDVESILQPSDRLGGYTKGYENYGQFFKQIGETLHQSCLLLNSQEKLREIILLENSTKVVHSLELPGLTSEEARELFRDKNLTGEQSWPEFVELYQGNPLALNLILVTIQKFFNGDVAKYMRLKATYLPAEITHILQERFAKISALEIKILTHLAQSSQPLSLVQLVEKSTFHLDFDDAIAAIESLQRRSLIEIKTQANETNFTLQPIVRKYVTKHHLKA